MTETHIQARLDNALKLHLQGDAEPIRQLVYELADEAKKAKDELQARIDARKATAETVGRVGRQVLEKQKKESAERIAKLKDKRDQINAKLKKDE